MYKIEKVGLKMATAKKTTAKKTTKKAPVKATPKKVGLTEEDKRALWLSITIIVVLAGYFVLTYFA